MINKHEIVHAAICIHLVSGCIWVSMVFQSVPSQCKRIEYKTSCNEILVYISHLYWLVIIWRFRLNQKKLNYGMIFEYSKSLKYQKLSLTFWWMQPLQPLMMSPLKSTSVYSLLFQNGEWNEVRYKERCYWFTGQSAVKVSINLAM